MPISRPHRTRTPQGADVTPRVGYYVVICTTNHTIFKIRPPTPYIFFKDLPHPPLLGRPPGRSPNLPLPP